ncbi:MAG: rRNA maturation RNase YbeY [Candidatus Sumerlaeota bacterium]
MDVLVSSHYKPPEVDGQTLPSLARRVVRLVIESVSGPHNSETSVLFLDNAEMRELNRDYRKIDRPTDVLAFAMMEGDDELPPDPDSPLILGDIVISLERAKEQADERGHSLRRETALLLIHGCLHLLGYDHETGDKKEAAKMRKQEQECLEMLERRMII